MIWTLPGDWQTVPDPPPEHDCCGAAGDTPEAADAIGAADIAAAMAAAPNIGVK